MHISSSSKKDIPPFLRPGEAAFLGVLGGIAGGAITGAIFSGNSQTLVIDGNIENWRQFESGIAKTPLPK